MIVRIPKSERDTTEKMACLCDCKATFYTMEAHPDLLQVEITEHNGDELLPEDAWNIGRAIVWSISSDRIKTL